MGTATKMLGQEGLLILNTAHSQQVVTALHAFTKAHTEFATFSAPAGRMTTDPISRMQSHGHSRNKA